MNEIDKLEQAFEKRRKRDGSLEQEINDQYISSYKNLRSYLEKNQIKNRLEQICKWYNAKILELNLTEKIWNLSIVEHFGIP